jgi:TnpA family transposase
MLRKLSAYPRQNGLALALREIGRLERSIFMLDWLQDIDLRDRRIENQSYRASGRNLMVAAIIQLNTCYLERALVDMGTPDEVARHIALLDVWSRKALFAVIFGERFIRAMAA